MARHSKTDLVAALQRMERAAEPSAEAQALAALNDPLLATKKLSEAIKKWQESSPDELFASEQDYHRFLQTCSRQLSAQIVLTMLTAVGQLEQKLTTDAGLVTAKDLGGIVSELGRQLALLRKEDASFPTSEADLDEQLRVLEQKFAAEADPNAPRH